MNTDIVPFVSKVLDKPEPPPRGSGDASGSGTMGAAANGQM